MSRTGFLVLSETRLGNDREVQALSHPEANFSLDVTQMVHKNELQYESAGSALLCETKLTL